MPGKWGHLNVHPFPKYCNRRNFHTRKNSYSSICQLSYARNFLIATVVSDTLVYVYGFRMLLNFVLSAKSTKYTKLNRVRKFVRLQFFFFFLNYKNKRERYTVLERYSEQCEPSKGIGGKKTHVSTVALDHVCVLVWRMHVQRCMCACICQKKCMR